MGNKEDVREKIEEHRQSIEENQNIAPSRMSRAGRQQSTMKGTAKKSKNPLITILLIVFIFIPLTILVYVSFFYEPTVPQEDLAAEGNETVVKVEKTEDVVKDTTEKPVVEKQEKEQDDTADVAAIKQSEADAAKLEQQTTETATETTTEEVEIEETTVKTHVVQSNETLYRIAMKYYGDPSGVEKIKKANHLPDETIAVGQTLTIPE